MKDAFDKEAEDLSRAGLIAPERRVEVARYLRARDRVSRMAFQQASPRPAPALKEHNQFVEDCCEILRMAVELEPFAAVEALRKEYSAFRDVVGQLDHTAQDCRTRLKDLQGSLESVLRLSTSAATALAALQGAVSPAERPDAGVLRPRR